jgi:hypothetical protein
MALTHKSRRRDENSVQQKKMLQDVLEGRRQSERVFLPRAKVLRINLRDSE